MTVIAILKGHTDRYGKQTVFIRIHNGKQRLHKATKIKLVANDWDKEKGYVRASHPNYKALNDSIKRTILEIEMNAISEKKKYAGADFFEYCTKSFNEWDHTKRFETLRQHWGEISKIKKFSSSIRIENITPEWLNRYSRYCYSLGNVTNTVWKTCKFLKMIIRKAVKEKVIEDNPFDIFQMPLYTDPEKVYLTREQVNAIEEISKGLGYPIEIKFAATWFAIGCYCGLRYSDMHNFNFKKHIKSNRIIIYTQKTGEVISIPLSEKLHSLFSRIHYEGLRFTNTHYNRLLKEIGALCDIDVKLTAHLSRFTFAMLAADSKISQEVTAKLLGHKSLKTTAIYYKISNSRIDDEIKKMY